MVFRFSGTFRCFCMPCNSHTLCRFCMLRRLCILRRLHQLRDFIIQIPRNGKLADPVRHSTIPDRSVTAVDFIADRTVAGISWRGIIPFIVICRLYRIEKFLIIQAFYRAGFRSVLCQRLCILQDCRITARRMLLDFPILVSIKHFIADCCIIGIFV